MRNTFFIVTLLAASTVHADVLTLPQAPANAAAPVALPAMPARGTLMQAVRQQLGEPLKRYTPVGGGTPQHPPITRWDYAGFSVFFENGHVIHTVIEGQPAPLHNIEELKTPQP